MTFDLLLVPIAQEHGVDVVGEVRRSEEDVGVGQPVTEEEKICVTIWFVKVETVQPGITKELTAKRPNLNFIQTEASHVANGLLACTGLKL